MKQAIAAFLLAGMMPANVFSAASLAESVLDDNDYSNRLLQGRGNIPVIDLSKAGQQLRVPEQIFEPTNGNPNRDLKVTLHYDVAEYIGSAFKTKVRVYNGQLPGPTIRVKPGDSFSIELINDLEEPLGNIKHNEFQKPNTTNIHTHGPHISGENPGDNIFVRVDPGQRWEYKYKIGTDHMPGSFWYHPHFHGSTALQTYSALGMIIIEDPPGYLPSIMENMPEIQCIISQWNLALLNTVVATSGDMLTDVTITDEDIETDAFLVNYQYKPVVTMQKGKWYRHRMVMGPPEQSLVMELGGDHDCEMGLIAKDGIYLNKIPRIVSTIILSPGNRADLVIKCNSVEQVKMVRISSGDHDFDPDYDGVDHLSLLTNAPSFYHCKEADTSNCPEIFIINVVAADNNDSPIQPFALPARPCYLADLRGVTPDDQFKVFFHIRTMDVNYVPWVNSSTYFKQYELGTVQETTTLPNGGHPYHQHVNPFQLVHVPHDDINDGPAVSEATRIWYQEGDWHDVIQYPRLLLSQKVKKGFPPNGDPFSPGNMFHDDNFVGSTVRWAADQFTGHMVFHCHKLNHEDQGMMGQYDLQGVEGTMWDGARYVDPSCVQPS